ncbi:hypothetical protein [Methyloceanibacter marginalis]|nr:hypothetical protein [Methyloceanibacter marginalis]
MLELPPASNPMTTAPSLGGSVLVSQPSHSSTVNKTALFSALHLWFRL